MFFILNLMCNITHSSERASQAPSISLNDFLYDPCPELAFLRELMTDDCTIADAHHDAASQSPSKDRQDC